jgi:glycosyltransferase involved in cell wall biosynthesis
MFPTRSLHLAGKGMPAFIRDVRMGGVEVLGLVEDAKQFMATRQVMLVPLHSGSGMRIKIIEGMAMGKTVISTRIGAEGIGAADGLDILIADDAKAFIKAMTRCVEEPEWCRQIGNRARDYVKFHFGTEAVSRELAAFYQGLA